MCLIQAESRRLKGEAEDLKAELEIAQQKCLDLTTVINAGEVQGVAGKSKYQSVSIQFISRRDSIPMLSNAAISCSTHRFGGGGQIA